METGIVFGTEIFLGTDYYIFSPSQLRLYL